MKRLSKANILMFVRFSCVGVLNTVIDTAVFFLACDFFGLNEIVSNIIAYMTSATNSYFLNSKFVYKEERFTPMQYLKFLAGNTSVLIISSLSLMLFARFFKIKTLAKLITVPITVVLNFAFQRFVVFRKSADKAVKESEEKNNA